MKKLNKKGFTLIELLAVIVILAIVLVVTIPSVLRAMDQARSSQLKNSADAVADWFQKNYDIDTLGGDIGGQVENGYNTFMSKEGNVWIDESGTSAAPKTLTLDSDVLKAAGIGGGATDIDTSASTVKLNNLTSKKICVHLVGTSDGKFKSGTADSANCS